MGLRSYGGLAQVALRCLCQLLLALPHFNFHNNIIVILAPLMNSSAPQVSRGSCCCRETAVPSRCLQGLCFAGVSFVL